jgi:hypothetical protein
MKVLFEVKHYVEAAPTSVFRRFDVVARKSDIDNFVNVLVHTYGMGAELRRPVYQQGDEFWVAEVRVVKAYFRHLMSIIQDLAMSGTRTKRNLFTVSEKTTSTSDLWCATVTAPTKAIYRLSKYISSRELSPHITIAEEYEGDDGITLLGVCVNTLYRQIFDDLIDEVNAYYEEKESSQAQA